MFAERLTASLTLTITGTSYTCSTRSLKKFDLELLPWGFRGSAEFWNSLRVERERGHPLLELHGQDLISMQIGLRRGPSSRSRRRAGA